MAGAVVGALLAAGTITTASSLGLRSTADAQGSAGLSTLAQLRPHPTPSQLPSPCATSHPTATASPVPLPTPDAPPAVTGARVIVNSHAGYLTGGPEALVQLTVALQGCADVAIIPVPLHAFFVQHYPPIAKVPHVAEAKLASGDIYIIPEVQGCDPGLVKRGVKVFIWLLGEVEPEKIAAERSKGCVWITHVWWLGHALGTDLVRQQLIRPYVTSIKVGNSTVADQPSGRSDLVLIDNDTPGHVVKAVQDTCKDGLCEAVLVNGFAPDALVKLLARAKIVVDWCMRGAERLPLEATLHGAVLVTSSCQVARDQRDFPLPERNVLSFPERIPGAIRRILRDFEQEHADMQPMRDLYRSIGPASMHDEACAFVRFASGAEGPGPKM